MRVAIEGGVVKYQENRAATLKIMVGTEPPSMRYAIITYPNLIVLLKTKAPTVEELKSCEPQS